MDGTHLHGQDTPTGTGRTYRDRTHFFPVLLKQENKEAACYLSLGKASFCRHLRQLERPWLLRAPGVWSVASVSPALCRVGHLQASPSGCPSSMVGEPGDPLAWVLALCPHEASFQENGTFRGVSRSHRGWAGCVHGAGTSMLEDSSQAMRPGDPTHPPPPAGESGWNRRLLVCVEFPGISDQPENLEKGADAASTATAMAIFSAYSLPHTGDSYPQVSPHPFLLPDNPQDRGQRARLLHIRPSAAAGTAEKSMETQDVGGDGNSLPRWRTRDVGMEQSNAGA